MSKNYALDSLKSREQEAFQRKQAAYERYAEARDRCNEAHDVMQAAWEERCSSREVMNHEYEEMQRANENYRAVWDEYGRIRDENNYEIERLRVEADSEHQEMIECFEKASDCYESGDKSEAPYWSQQGHDHKDRRDSINEEVRRLCQEVKAAKQNAEWRAPRTDSSAFHRAKDEFGRAKSRHESAQKEFKYLKAERDRLKAEFDSAQAEHVHLKEEFQRKLEEVKSNSKREREKTLDKAGVCWSERDDAKIVKKADGTTQIYHGGLGKADGFGHGHTALDSSGNKTYSRDAFTKHGHQNYIDDPSLVTYSSRGQWSDIRHGWIEGHKVTWSEGMGVNAGQTLIRDGWVVRKNSICIMIIMAQIPSMVPESVSKILLIILEEKSIILDPRNKPFITTQPPLSGWLFL